LNGTNKQTTSSQLHFSLNFANIGSMETKVKKRIPCKIISSVPINSKETAIVPMNEKFERLHESDELHAANFWSKQTHRVSTAGAFGICMGILNTIPTGQILDCLA